MTTLPWADLEPALSTLFERIATVPGSQPSVEGSLSPSVVQGRSLPNQFAAPSSPATLYWHVAKVSGVGRDELREDYDPDLRLEGDTFEPDPEDPEARLGAIVESVHGQRDWEIQIRVESPNQSVPASEHFRALVDRMRLPSVRDELVATGLAYRGWEEIVDDEYDGEDGRAVSVYVGRLYFNGASYAQDAPITTIERAKINGVTLP